MSQSKVTDFFNASRKGVQRNSKRVEAVERGEIKKKTNIQTIKETKVTCDKRSKSKVYDRIPDDQDSSYSPAFKRFRYLVPPNEDVTSSSVEPVCRTSSKKTEFSVTTSPLRKKVASPAVSNNFKSPSVSSFPGGKVDLESDLSESAEDTNVSVNSNVKTSLRQSKSSNGSSLKAPAYQRFAHLIPTVSEAKPSVEPTLPELPLPYAYQNLRDIFKALDGIANMLFSRKELMTFHKLQEAVQKVVRRDFNEQTLGRIRALYKGSYSVRYEKYVPKFGRKASSKYELIVDVNLKEDETPMSTLEETKLIFNGTRLVQRREKFLSKIMTNLLAKHEEFLCKELQIQTSDLPPSHSIKRWHPRFPMDKIEAPEPEPMPPRPDADERRILSAQDAVAIFKEKAMLREAVACERAAAQFNGSKEMKGKDMASQEKKSQKEGKPKEDKLRGVSKSLIERIRAKQTAKAANLLNRGGPEWEKKQAMLSRLPDLAIHTWNLFATTRKPVLSINYLCEKISDSHPSGLSESSVLDHIRLLAESLPGWLELLDWTTPHARICDMKRNLADVRACLMKLVDDNAT